MRLTSSLNPSVFGQAVTFTVTVAVPYGGTPNGMVTFKDGATTLGSVTLASGKALLTTAKLTSGSHSIMAMYNGSGNYLSSTSGVIAQKVNLASTTATLAATPSPSSFGQPVKLTATVKSGTLPATGSVTFKNGATTVGTGICKRAKLSV